MKLYGSPTSPFVRHCRIALAQENLDFEFINAEKTLQEQYSATDKVPFFVDSDLNLNDSTSILKYVREKSGKGFLTDIEDFDTYTVINTLLDSAINLFLIENEGISAEQINYLGRQKQRVDKGLIWLNEKFKPNNAMDVDCQLRCTCFIGWGLFRNRFSLDGLANLEDLLSLANEDELFLSTAPIA